MAYKMIVFLTLLALSNAALQSGLYLGQSAAVYASGHSDVERYAPAIYDFAYSVHDSQTGDIKSQHESRRGDVVQGQYSLLDADGLTRIVDYHADDQTGFTAHVRRQPGNSQPPISGITSLSPQSHPVASKPSQQLIHKPNQFNAQSQQQHQQLQQSQQQHQLQQSQQQISKPSAAQLLQQFQPLAPLQSAPLSIHQQGSSFGIPLHLTPQSSQISFGHTQSFPFALSHQTAAPLALTPSYAPLAALPSSSLVSHQGLITQPSAALTYKQPAHALFTSPYAITHSSAPITYQTATPLSHYYAPATLALHH